MEERIISGEKTTPPPKVSIILPTYNRAQFLPQALDSIRSQTFADWELIIVDDGSTDNTREILPKLCEGIAQPVRFIYQENQGAYGARNTGLDAVRGEYDAFYDSDDVWLAHHLEDCVEALETNPEVDWVYGSSQVVDYATGRVLAPHAFHVEGQPRPFLRLHTRCAGPLKIIEDPDAVECAIRTGLFAGLQVSVMRHCIFHNYRFEAIGRNEAEDQLVVVHMLAGGRHLAYLDNVHLVYHVHDQNSSATGTGSVNKHLRVFRALAEGYEELRKQVCLTPAQTRALNQRLSREYFWNIGYKLLQYPGHEDEAMASLRRGLRLWPTNLRYWKTYLLCWLRVVTGLYRRRTPQLTRSA